MTKGKIGAAISTTGDEHRMAFLETAVREWRRCLPGDAVLVVTVDGGGFDCARALAAVEAAAGAHEPVEVYRVEKFVNDSGFPHSGRLGVAANKNTGIEILMDTHDVTHLFLADDDIWPLYPQSVNKHVDLKYYHSMVNWGKHRLVDDRGILSIWSWPRGSMLYVHRDVVHTVGGMVEEFGPGGHEHVEYSQRVCNEGLTPFPFISPASYATRNGLGAAALWHAEDMPRPGEPLGNLRQRRKAITSVKHQPGDWDHIEAVMARMEGSSQYVGFRAHENGRASATLCQRPSGIGGEK